MDTSKGTERVNEEGATEIKVDSVDYRSPPGQDQQPRKENVEVTHVKHADHDKPVSGGGVIGEAAAKVAEKIQAAKGAVCGKTEDTSNEKNK